MRVLAVGAHPDDVELGIGATLAKMSHAGDEVLILDLTSGEPTPFGSVKTRRAESDRAAELIGAKERIRLDLPNRELTDSIEARRAVAEVYRAVRPDMILTQAGPDYHPDHISASSICWKARFDAKLTKSTMTGEPYWAPFLIHFLASHMPRALEPSFVLDISDEFAIKRKLIQIYASQFKAAKREEMMLDKIESIARHYGALVGVRYGEPFFAREVLRLKSLASIMGR